MTSVSLIIPYRKRRIHFELFIQFIKPLLVYECIEVIILESDSKPTIQNELLELPIEYYYLESTDIKFHKSKILNIGLEHAAGSYIVPYDIDLIPLNNSLIKHLQMADISSELLITGYRLMLNENCLPTKQSNFNTAPEDSYSALLKNLTTKEKFGVCPFFNKSRLEQINGWDEKFIGWGAEDQDLIQRYCSSGINLVRSPDLVYAHLPHGQSIGWNDANLTKKNRAYYYKKLL